MTPLCNNTSNTFSVINKNKFVNPAQDIKINQDQERKEGIEVPRVTSYDKPNPMGYHMNNSLYYEKGSNKPFKPNHTKNISLVIEYRIVMKNKSSE